MIRGKLSKFTYFIDLYIFFQVGTLIRVQGE